MPRHIIRSAPRSPKHDRFVKKLAQELKLPGTQPQPLILEEEVPATGSRHVHVIWDQWKKLPDEERTDVIIEAYGQAESKEYAEQITIASGLTSAEALALGLLPWRLEPTLTQDERSEADCEQALRKEADFTLLGVKHAMDHGLRYARREDADAALKRLQQILPGSSWRMVRDVFTDS
jgi:hypothetical protein